MPATHSRIHPGLADKLVEHVFEAVLTGRLAQGSEITEDELAEEFGVSRTPVREAVRRLAEMGVVIVRPRCGLMIAHFDEEDLEQITVLRAELECLALRLAMDRMDDNQIVALEEAAQRCKTKLKTRDRFQIFESDSQFHLMIADFSGNLHLADALRRLDVKVQLCRMVFCPAIRKIKTSIQCHDEILIAIRKRQTKKAVELLRGHIMSSVRSVNATKESASR